MTVFSWVNLNLKSVKFLFLLSIYNLYVLMFRNTRYGDRNFHLFMFQFVSKRFKTIESVEIDIFSLF